MKCRELSRTAIRTFRFLLQYGFIVVLLGACGESEIGQSARISAGQACEVAAGSTHPLALVGNTPTDAVISWEASAGGLDPNTGLTTTFYAPLVTVDSVALITVKISSGSLNYSDSVECMIRAPATPTAPISTNTPNPTATIPPQPTVPPEPPTTTLVHEATVAATHTPEVVPTDTPMIVTETATPQPEAVFPSPVIRPIPDDKTYRNPFVFEWLGPSTAQYRVILNHTEQGFHHESTWVTGNFWQFNIPDEQFGGWEWFVETRGGQRSATDFFWFDPYDFVKTATAD